MKSPIYLSPIDFSTVSETAMRLALDLAIANDGSVLMLHFVDKKQAVKEARERFVTFTENLTDAERALVTTKVLVGNIYDSISIASDVVGASLIVMGTHGATGLQKLFGSHALKLVSSTSTPFMITQGGNTSGPIKNIVMPYYFERESLQIASFAASIAKQFNATIHLVGSHHTDEWLAIKTQTNQTVLRRFFAEHGIKCELQNLQQRKTYEQELLAYAESVDADLLAVSYHHSDTFLPTMHSFVQHLLENDRQIPVLTVNTEDLTLTSGYAFIST
ncbi:MAG TPA: universal stress protein [Fluviicola sp.]|nr:universal stress protein [Fluviicola sp.]